MPTFEGNYFAEFCYIFRCQYYCKYSTAALNMNFFSKYECLVIAQGNLRNYFVLLYLLPLCIANITETICSYELILIILRFLCCHVYYISNVYCYEKLNLFKKYLISERLSVIYPHSCYCYCYALEYGCSLPVSYLTKPLWKYSILNFEKSKLLETSNMVSRDDICNWHLVKVSRTYCARCQ